MIVWLFLIHLLTTLFMLGVIWFVQVVHYPLFAKVGAADFPDYEQIHVTLTGRVVALPMIVELLTGFLLVWFKPAEISFTQCTIGLALLAVIWLSTMQLQVPAHESLARGFDPAVQKKLVATNWLRTVAWSLRGLLVLFMAAAMIG